MSNTKTVKLPEKLGFMSFSMASNIVYNFRSLYYLIFLTNVMKVPVLTAGTILTIGTIWDGINDPLIGLFCANRKFKNGERVRPYVILTALPWAISLILLFTVFRVSLTWKVILCLVIYFVYEAINTFHGVPYNAMASLASGDDADRKSINGFRSLGAGLGSGIGAVAITPIVKLYGGLQGEGAIIGEGDARALLLTAITMGIICVTGCCIHYFTTKERVHAMDEDNEDKMTLIEAYRILFRCKSWIKNMLYITCYGILNTLVMSAVNYYAAYVLGASSKATPIMAMYLVMSLIVSMLTPAIDNKLGRKKTMLLGAAILVVGKIPFILMPYSVATIYINALSVGIGATISFIMFNTNRNNIADIVELQSHRRMDSMVSTGDNLASKIATAIVTEGMALALAAAGFDEALKANQTQATLNTICSFLGWVPIVIATLMFILLLFMDPEKEKKEAEEQAKAASNS